MGLLGGGWGWLIDVFDFGGLFCLVGFVRWVGFGWGLWVWVGCGLGGFWVWVGFLFFGLGSCVLFGVGVWVGWG